MVGNTLWSWKSNCVGCSNDTWTVFEIPNNASTPAPVPANGALFPSRRALLGRVHSRGAVGEVLAAAYNQSTHAFALAANASAAHAAAVDAARAAEARACPAGGAPGYALLPGAGGWALCGLAPPRAAAATLHLAPADFDAALPRALAAGGTVTEIFVPANVPGAPAAVDNAEAVGAVAWPDGARSFFFRPLKAGVYSVAAPPAAAAAAAAAAAGGGGGAASWDARAAVRAAAAAAPTAADAAAAAAAAAGPGAAALGAWAAWVRDGAARAGVPLPA